MFLVFLFPFIFNSSAVLIYDFGCREKQWLSFHPFYAHVLQTLTMNARLQKLGERKSTRTIKTELNFHKVLSHWLVYRRCACAQQKTWQKSVRYSETWSKWQRYKAHKCMETRNPKRRALAQHKEKQKANLIESKWANINAFVNFFLSFMPQHISQPL